jgi:glycosyltransferase involved in cell wall biosynthesis
MTLMQAPDIPLSVVVLARNEEQNIARVLRGILHNVKEPFDIIVVNDSVDNTAGVVREISAAYRNVRCIPQEGGGYTQAIATGVRHARGEALVVVVGDGSDDPADIETMRQKIRDGFDIVCASRYMKDGSAAGANPVQGAFSRLACWGLKTFAGLPTRDASNSFKMYRTRIFERIELRDSGYATSMQITLRSFFNGDRIAEVPTAWKDRSAGTSKFAYRTQARHYLSWFSWALLQAVTSRFRRGRTRR